MNEPLRSTRSFIFAHSVEGEAPAEPSPGSRARLGGSLALHGPHDARGFVTLGADHVWDLLPAKA